MQMSSFVQTNYFSITVDICLSFKEAQECSNYSDRYVYFIFKSLCTLSFIHIEGHFT